MTDRFEYCFGVVIAAEGGYVDHKNDRGGKTNYGITQKTLDVYNEEIGAQKYSVKDITVDVAMDIYRQYWIDSKSDLLPEPLDLLVFDCAINSGAGRAIKVLQGVVDADVDGIYGHGTEIALDVYVQRYGVYKTCFDYLAARKSFYRHIVDRDPSQAVFLKGWYNRITKLEKLVEDALA